MEHEINTDRKLATVAKILEVEPIQNADNIVKVTVRGWELVAKKGEFQVGDLCVYLEIDSLVPEDNPVFSFMKPRNFRVRTIKLRGVLSQGLALPLEYFPEIDKDSVKEDDDVTELLKVVKYEVHDAKHSDGPPEFTKPFPAIIQKTECTRIQNLRDYKDTLYYLTEKLDGTSATFGYSGNGYKVCSRNLQLQEELADTHNKWWQVSKMYNLEEKLKAFPNIIVQGEIIGPKIGGNMYKVSDYQLYIFRAQDLNKGVFLGLEELQALCKALDVKIVPVIKQDLKLEPKTNKMWLTMAQVKSVINKDVDQEGFVLSPQDSVKIDDFESVKIISNKYLLKKK